MNRTCGVWGTILICLTVTGDPGVQFALGQYHFSRQDYANAFKYFEKAAGSRDDSNNHFSLQAKYQLGVMYFDGLGVKEDPVSHRFPN